MMCYQISQNGEAVALVAGTALARRFVECQAPGFYQVDALEIGEPISRRKPRRRESSTKQKIRRGRHKPSEQPAQGVYGSAAVVSNRARHRVH
jgi:hypothetical protein